MKNLYPIHLGGGREDVPDLPSVIGISIPAEISSVLRCTSLSTKERLGIWIYFSIVVSIDVVLIINRKRVEE